MTAASPPAARYSLASLPAANPPPTTTMGSTAITHQYPISCRSYPGGCPHAKCARAAYPSPVAVLIASDLRKEFSGDPLFDGISFSGCAGGERLALAGQNGAGQDDAPARDRRRDVDPGRRARARRRAPAIALHDQRPPRDQGLTLREYSLSGAADLVAIEEELARLEQAMATRRPRRRDDAPLQRGAGAARARRRLGLARPRRVDRSAASGFATRPRPAARPFSGGELTRASLAPRARRPTPTSCCSTSRRTTSTSRASSGSSAS